MAINLYDYVASIPDYPEKGIVFRDILPLMANGEAFKQATDEIANYARDKHVDMVVGPEARGFIVGCPVAYELGVGFAPARKKGKLPRPAVSSTYDRGTISATIDMVEQMGGIVVGCAFLIDLKDLNGREKLKGYDVKTLIEFEGE